MERPSPDSPSPITVPASRRKTRPSRLPIFGVLAILLPLLFLPLAAVFVFASRSGWAGFSSALQQPEALFALRFSLLMGFATAAVNSVIGTFTAYVLSKYRFPGRDALSILVNLPVALPTVVVGTSLLLLWGPIGLLGKFLDPLGIQPMFSAAGILLAHVLVTFPYMLGAVRPVLDTLEATYEEAAYTIGASRWQTFWLVILPALRGGIFTGTLLSFAHSLGEFGATVLVSGNLRLRTQTAPLYVFSQFEAGNLEAANAVAAVLAVISFLLFLFLQRFARRPERPES